jgi:hypothetical protein
MHTYPNRTKSQIYTLDRMESCKLQSLSDSTVRVTLTSRCFDSLAACFYIHVSRNRPIMHSALKAIYFSLVMKLHVYVYTYVLMSWCAAACSC